MQPEIRQHVCRLVKDEKLLHMKIRRVKYLRSLALEKSFSKKVVLALGHAIAKNLKFLKTLYRLKLKQSTSPPELSEELLNKVKTSIYQRFGNTLTCYRGLMNFPQLRSMKALRSVNLFWEKSLSEVPSYLKKLTYLDVLIKKDTWANEKDMIKLKRMNSLKEMKMTGTTCQLWKFFAFLKGKITSSTPNFHLCFTSIDFDPSNIQKYASKMPWFNHKSMDYINFKSDSMLCQLIPLTGLMAPLQHFGYDQFTEPRAESILPHSSTLQLFQNFENIISLSLNFYENVDKKVLENFFLYLCFPKYLESFKLTMFLKDFLVNRCCVGHYYSELQKLKSMKELTLMGKFTNPPKADVIERLWKHYIEVLKSLESCPLEFLTIGLQSSQNNQINYEILFDQTFLPVIWKFDRLRELKLFFHLAKISCMSMGVDAFQDGIFTNLDVLFIHAADIDPRVLKFLKATARSLTWLSLDLYAPLLFAKLIDLCKFGQSVKTLNYFHIQPYMTTMKDGKEPEYYQKALIGEIMSLYRCLINLRKACLCFPQEEIDIKYCDFIASCFKWNKKIECTKVETKSWSIWSDPRKPGQYRICKEE